MSSEVVINKETVSVVEIDRSTIEINVQKETTEVLISQAQGPQGPQGNTGPTGPQGPPGTTPELFSYRHIQSVSSSTWQITHNLGWYPNTTVVDSAGSVVEGEIDYVSENNLILTFSSPFSGIAYLS
jgi:hypothetical protein